MNTSFLKNLGQILNAGVGVVSILSPTLGPLIGALIPSTKAGIQNINDELPEIADTIVKVEAIGQALSLQGPDKLKISIPLVTQIIMKSKLMYEKVIKNAALFQQGVTKIADGMVDILNSITVEDKKTPTA